MEKENILTGTKLTLTYDERGQLIRAILPGGQTIQYSIDGESKRLAKTVDGVLASVYLYDAQGRLVAELEPSGNIKSRFIYATQAHSPDYMIRGGVNYFFAKDQLGSIRAVVDSNSGNVLQLIQYDEFGRVLADTNPGFQPFGFAGGHYDHQTGLVRFGARDYDPEVGRWVSKDPILFNGGQANLYSYIEDEPINQVDPMGTGPLAALTCAASLLVFSTPAILDSAYNNYEIERLKSAKSSTSDCPPTAKNNIDNQIEKLRDQNRAADEYMQSLTDMRGICYSLIFTPGP